MKPADVTASVYLGIDVAKEKVDCVLLVESRSSYHVFANTPAGFEQLGAWLRREQAHRVHACLEATGSYSDALARAAGTGPYRERPQPVAACQLPPEPLYPQQNR